jgi:hypothetical protein
MKKILACLFALSAVLLNTRAAAALPDKVRVLSVDLQNTRIEPPGAPGSEVSQELRHILEMADVDVLCVQGATDWENCERICQLKPGLQVLTCSAFTNTPQVAILARVGAVLSWVDETEGGNGFALAIVQCSTRKLAFFAAQSAKANASPNSVPGVTDAILREVKKLKKFPQNRPDSFIVGAAGLSKTTILTDDGFQSVGAEPPKESAPHFLVLNGGFLTRPRAVSIKGLSTPLVISDFDTSSSFSSKFAYQTPLLFPGETLASYEAALHPPAPAPAPAPAQSNRLVLWAIGGVAFLLFIALFFRRPRPATMQLVPLTNGATGPNGPMLPVDDPVRSNLVAWLKSAFLQRLISHRQELINNEAEATRRTMVIEEKLSNLQSALQARISAYETRIERLEQELTAATLDNRELIRAQIELLKEKVAKAKQDHALGRN